MRRRTRVLLIAAAVLVVAVVSGTLLAMGLGGGSGGVPRPTGAQTVLRIQPVDEKVSCGPGGAAAYIFLDDLQARPSPNNAAVAYGAAGWQLLLQYDPKVLRIQSPTDIELNPELSRRDADGDGITRSFFPVSNIDDAAGRALIGAASLVAGGPDLANEEGLDPVAKGEPLLLTTVRFQTVGHGSTTLTLSDPGKTLPAALQPGIYDASGNAYDAPTFKDATIAVEGGNCPQVALNTPLPTVGPTHTPFIPPTWTPVPWRTVQPQDARAVGRGDCPSDWAAYTDPQKRFSVCYPKDWTAVSDMPGADLGTVLAISLPGVGGVLTIYGRSSSYFTSPDASRCNVAPSWDGAHETSVTVMGKTVSACTGYENQHGEGAPPLLATFAEVPVDGGGYVTIFSYQPQGNDYAAERDALTSVLQSIRSESEGASR